METTPQGGGYALGFKVDPKQTLEYVHKEMSSLLQVCVPEAGQELAASVQDPVYCACIFCGPVYSVYKESLVLDQTIHATHEYSGKNKPLSSADVAQRLLKHAITLRAYHAPRVCLQARW